MKPSEAFDVQRTAIKELLEANQARSPRVFGSVACGNDNDRSDLDLLIDSIGATTALDIAGIEMEPRQLLGVPVHTTTTSALRGP